MSFGILFVAGATGALFAQPTAFARDGQGDAPYANRLNAGLPCACRTAANFEGGRYLRGSHRW